MKVQEGTGIKLISEQTSHVIPYHCSTMNGIRNGIPLPSFDHRWYTEWYTSEGYIRTLIHVLSLVLRDQYKSISIGYILVSDSSALNQQPSIRARLALFLYSLPLSILPVDYLTEPGGGDTPIDALRTGPGGALSIQTHWGTLRVSVQSRNTTN